MTLLKTTKSVCPDCLQNDDKIQVIDASLIEKNGKVIIEKQCKKHGKFEDIYWGDSEAYKRVQKFGYDGNAGHHETEGITCPISCGLCPLHKTQTFFGHMDVTNRCNQRCPTCFANSAIAGYVFEPSFEEIEKMLRFLRSLDPPCPGIQFLGGEPTVREDMVEIVRLAKNLGFNQIQMASNGIKLATDPELAKKFREAGLSTVYLQFDGFTPEIYEKLRGYNALPRKLAAIEACRKAGQTVVLVPTIAKGINDDQLGKFVYYGLENIDIIRGINFQPVSFVGRIDKKERLKQRITIPDLVNYIEEQTDGQISKESFFPVPFSTVFSEFAENFKGKKQHKLSPHVCCGLATYVFTDKGKLISIGDFLDIDGVYDYFKGLNEKLRNKEIGKTTAIFSLMRNVSKYIDNKKKPKELNFRKLILNVFLKRSFKELSEFHRKALFIGIMHFQDEYNYDIERVQRCAIQYIVPGNKIIPFCAYNTFQRLYRERVEKEFSIPIEKWKRKNSKKII